MKRMTSTLSTIHVATSPALSKRAGTSPDPDAERPFKIARPDSVIQDPGVVNELKALMHAVEDTVARLGVGFFEVPNINSVLNRMRSTVYRGAEDEFKVAEEQLWEVIYGGEQPED